MKTSILGYNWQVNEFDERVCKTMMQRFEISEILARLLAMRGVAIGEVENFLNPKIKTNLPNPFDLDGVLDGVLHVIEAIKQNKKITIFADYDVDGATSAALFVRFFRAINVDVDIYIPDRILEGYGPNRDALLKLKNSGTDLVIMLDCGAVAFEPLLAAFEAGLEIIVIDHHLGALEKPKAISVINPNSIGEKFAHKNLCAAGVSFLFLVALNSKLREIGFYESTKIVEPNLINLLDLVALGSVCDVMTLTGANRSFVDAGLKIMAKRQNLGIKIICDLAKLDQKPSAYHLGFVIGPRINAGGRIGKSDLGARLLSSDDEIEVLEIAKLLEKLNSERKEIENQALEEAINNLENSRDGFSKDDAVIFAISKNYHQGIIGIIASRLKDKFEKPVCVIALDEENNRGKASCRSISGIDFGKEILNAKVLGILIEGGGHAAAGGFSVAINKIRELHAFFNEKLGGEIAKINSQKIKNYDIALDLAQVNVVLLQELSKLEPFGNGNSKPKFLIRDVIKLRAKLVGQTQEHVSCFFSAKNITGFSGNLQAIAFRSASTILGEILMDEKVKNFNLIGTLEINNYLGNSSVQMIIEDVVI